MPVLLVHGDNHPEIEEEIAAIRGRFEAVDVLTFDGTDVPLPALSEACLTAGLFSADRLVIVNALHERIKGKGKDVETEEIRALLAGVAPSTTLLLVSRDLTDDHALIGVVRETDGEVRSRLAPRKGDAANWLAARAKRKEIAIDRAAVELLVSQVGNDPLTLQTELEKVATYAGRNVTVTPDMVEALVGTVPQDSIFALVDAVAAGDRAKALRLLHEQLDRASSGPIEVAMYLIRMLARQMRILLRIRLGREQGRPRSEIISELKIPRYYADRYFRQADRLSDDRIRTTFEQLAALEYALKSGRAEAGTGLDLLVSDLCA